MRQAAKNGLAAAAVGSAGAFLFWLVGAPLPFMLGAMSASAAAAVAGKPWAMPRQARDFARPVIGVLAGSAFTPAVLAHAGEWAGIILIVILFGVVSTLCGYFLFRRVCKFDRATAFFASTPAGLSEMSLLGDSLGGNIRTLFLVHSIRIIAVIFLVPVILEFATGADLGAPRAAVASPEASAVDWALLGLCGVAGYLLGKRARIPSGVMIVAMLLSAALHLSGLTSAAPPSWLVVIVQIVIGCVVGARFAGFQWAEVRNTVVFAAAWAVLLLAGAALTALAAAQLFAASFSSLLLALAPGGMVEMTLITYALGIDVVFVVTCQVLRNFSTVLIAPAVFRRIAR